MAGWGTGTFENEDAANWLGELVSLTPEDVVNLLTSAADTEQYLDAPVASVVVAAAEVVAVSAGAPGDKVPREVTLWAERISEPPSSRIKELTVRALDRVRRNSELKDLWLEAEGLNEWIATIQDLQTRLVSAH